MTTKKYSIISSSYKCKYEKKVNLNTFCRSVIRGKKQTPLLTDHMGALGSISSICLRAAFTISDPKSAKKLLDLTVFFALLGSALVKAACKMLVKLTLGRGRHHNSNIFAHNKMLSWYLPSIKYCISTKTYTWGPWIPNGSVEMA